MEVKCLQFLLSLSSFISQAKKSYFFSNKKIVFDQPIGSVIGNL